MFDFRTLPHAPLARLRAGLAALGIVIVASGSCPDGDRGPEPVRLPVEAVRTVVGEEIRLEAPPGGALVLLFLWTECPISNQYSPTLNAIASQADADRVRVVGLFVDLDKTDREVAEHAESFELAFPASRAESIRLARALGVGTVPEAVLIDDRGRVRYQGRINDQYYALGRRRQVLRTSDLGDAIAAVLAGEEVREPRTEAIGCTLPDFGEAVD